MRRTGLEETRRQIEPPEALPECDDGPDDGDHRWLEPGGLVEDVGQCASDRFLGFGRPPANQGDGGVAGATVGQQFFDDPGEGLCPHEDDDGVHRGREFFPVHGRLDLAHILVPGDDGKG